MTNHIKIVVVVESIDVDDSSGSKANVAFISNLKEAGFDVEVFHYTQKNIQIDSVPCTRILENRRSILFLLSRIERFCRNILKMDLHKPLEKFFGFSFTLLNDRNSIATFLDKNLSKVQPDLIITLSKGGSFRPHHALLLLPSWHKRWMAYVHDPYPMHLYPRPFNWVEPGYYKKWRFVKDVSEKASFSAFPSRLLLEWMGSYFPKFNKNSYIIPHQIQNKTQKTIELPNFFDPGNFNLLHAGTLLSQRNPEGLLQGFQLFLKKYPVAKTHARLIFIGNQNFFSSWFTSQVSQMEEVISREYLPFEIVLKVQQETSVNIILEAKSEISPFLPGKFPHCVQADRPILLLGPYYSESKRLLGENYPYWTESDQVEKIAGLISDLYGSWVQNHNLKLNRPELREYLSIQYLKSTINGILDS